MGLKLSTEGRSSSILVVQLIHFVTVYPRTVGLEVSQTIENFENMHFSTFVADYCGICTVVSKESASHPPSVSAEGFQVPVSVLERVMLDQMFFSKMACRHGPLIVSRIVQAIPSFAGGSKKNGATHSYHLQICRPAGGSIRRP